MINYEKIQENKKDQSNVFNIVAGVRVIFLVMGLFSSMIELGMSFSIVEIGDTATAIMYNLLIVTVVNIILLIIYIQTVKIPNHQSSFLIYIVEVLTSAFGLLGAYAFIRYITTLEIATLPAVIGLVGIIDLILINAFIGTYFVSNYIKEGLVEIAIGINIVIIMILLFI